MHEEKVAVPGGHLKVVVGGTGPTILFVHGFPLDHSMWRQQTALSDHYRCLMPDLRGFGASMAEVEPVLTMRRFAEDLAIVLDELAPRESIHLCGLSMGGYVAFEFWNLFPQRLKSLILCDTRAANDSVEVARGREIAAQQIMQQGSQEFVSGMLQKLFAELVAPEVINSTQQVMLATSPTTLAGALLGMSQRKDFVPRLSEVNIPTLAICGEQDRITPLPEMRSLASAMPQAKLVEIAAAGHMAPLERPEPVNAAIREFISSVAEI